VNRTSAPGNRGHRSGTAYSIYKRLQQLEDVSAHAREQRNWQDRETDRQNARRKITLFLKCRGVEQQGNESLREARARALEITCKELDRLVAAWMCPIRNYVATKSSRTVPTRGRGETWPTRHLPGPVSSAAPAVFRLRCLMNACG
jgi:hypothetical protein